VHLIVDNYATHKHAKVRTWLGERPRFHIHYTPTYSSWLNQVERWFGLITQQAIRRGSFRSVRELVARINQFVQHLQSQLPPLRLDRYSRFHPAEACPTLFTYFRDTTLVPGCEREHLPDGFQGARYAKSCRPASSGPTVQGIAGAFRDCPSTL